MKSANQRMETRLIHAGEPSPRLAGAVSMPVFQSSTYEYTNETGYDDIKYIRMNNTPNHTALQEKLAALENAESALVTSSGMAAITTTLLTLLSPGDHFLAQSCLYGGTHEHIVGDLNRLGISFDFIDGANPESWALKLRSNTRAIYVETLTNPMLEVADLKSVAEFAKSSGIISIIDNTFASPINFRPSEWGFDISLHSCTKYLNGHSDIVAGAVIGRGDIVDRITHTLIHLGGTLDPHACFLLHRGIKTLALRIRYQNGSALAISRFLKGHPAVESVNYPGLETHPGHGTAAELLDGFGGMLSFEVKGGVNEAKKFMENITIPLIAPSLGGVESLVTRPVTTSHSGMSPQDLEAAGISDRLIRLSVGIEATEDLISDLGNALKCC